MVHQVYIFSKSYCSFCKKAIQIVKSYKNLKLTVVELDTTEDGEELHREIKRKTKHNTVPIVYIDEVFIGGYDTLLHMHNQNQLVDLK